MILIRRLSLIFPLIAFTVLLGCDDSTTANKKPAEGQVNRVVLQLNWLHDPTFTGEYLAAEADKSFISIKVGGPNIFPLNELKSGQANFAVVGADIFLRALDKDQISEGRSELLAVFVDFQRNPVGWVLHPDAGDALGFPKAAISDRKLANSWMFSQLRKKRLLLGDKRGTETTSVWLKWRDMRGLGDEIKVVPVGFDASIILDAPKLLFPVYLNEEPFKLSAKLSRPLIEFDPADDGVRLYGNVLLTTRKFFDQHPTAVKKFTNLLTLGWYAARHDLNKATAVVAKLYHGVDKKIIREQVKKTLSFVFEGTKAPGDMDVSENGLWHTTLVAMNEAGVLSNELTLEILKKHLLGSHEL
jgi:hypothetical protein